MNLIIEIINKTVTQFITDSKTPGQNYIKQTDVLIL
jgi:hypothetical protein